MEGDCNVYAHSSLWMRPTASDRLMRKRCIQHIFLRQRSAAPLQPPPGGPGQPPGPPWTRTPRANSRSSRFARSCFSPTSVKIFLLSYYDYYFEYDIQAHSGMYKTWPGLAWPGFSWPVKKHILFVLLRNTTHNQMMFLFKCELQNGELIFISVS